MHGYLRLQLLSICVASTWVTPVLAADQKTTAKPLAGWFAVFPEIHYFALTIDAPVVEQREMPTTYRQTASYQLSDALLKVTLARDRAFKNQYERDLKRMQEVYRAEEIRLDNTKFTAWMWKEAVKEGKHNVKTTVLVLLPDDKTVLVEGFDRKVEGAAGVETHPLARLKQLDLERVRSALDKPPRTSFGPRLEDFKVIPKGALYRDVAMWIDQTVRGEPVEDRDKNLVYAWILGDKSRVLVCLERNSHGRVVYIKHDKGEGKVDDLVK